MSNQKGSSEKKPKLKKDYSTNNKKITDFFSNFRNVTNSNHFDDINPIFGKSENAINIMEEEEIEHEEKFINLINGENSNLFLNNHNQLNNNSNIKKLKKKNMEEKNHNEINNKDNKDNKDNKEINHFEFPKKNNFYPSYFINLNTHSYSDEKRNLILAELLNDNQINLLKLSIVGDNFQNINDYHKSFPFQNCRIININNAAYIIGGKLNDDISKLNYNNELGVTNCYKLIYNKDKKEIKIYTLPSTIYQHQSHSLLYLQKYNTIVLLSGYKQKHCEYLNLQNNGIENKWKHIYPLRKVRENAISLLFNDKYIFIIGGNDLNGNINQDYEVLNYDLFINMKYLSYWKKFSFTNNNYKIFEQKGSGVLYYNNDIFIVGGFNSNKEFLSWKINFEDYQNDEIVKGVKGGLDKDYKINSFKSCDNINKYIINSNNNNNCYSFCGEQVFMNYKDFFVNISFGGQLMVIPNSILN